MADRTISDAEELPESRTVAQILAQSSNVGAVKIGLELGADRFYKWVRRLRLRRARPGCGSRARSRARSTSLGVLRLDHGQPSDRPGPVGDADADGGRLLAIANGGIMRPAATGLEDVEPSPVDAGRLAAA